MRKLYTIKGENQTIRVFILNKSTRELIKSGEIKRGFVVVQDFNTGETKIVKRSKLIFDQEYN